MHHQIIIFDSMWFVLCVKGSELFNKNKKAFVMKALKRFLFRGGNYALRRRDAPAKPNNPRPKIATEVGSGTDAAYALECCTISKVYTVPFVKAMKSVATLPEMPVADHISPTLLIVPV